MNQLKIKNHFVPKSYLKNWSDNDNKIFIYNSLVSHEGVPLWKKDFIKSNAYQKHLYTSIESGVVNDDIERWFDQKFESPAEPIIKKVINDSKLSYGEMTILLKFLALQDVRTPKQLIETIDRHTKNINDMLPKILDGMPNRLNKKNRITSNKANYNKFLPINITSEIEDGADFGTLKVETLVGRKPWFFSMLHLLEKTSKILLKYKWKIIKPYDGMKWVTSDNPVIKINYIRHGQYDLKGGWGRHNGNIFFPIGPNHALFTKIGAKKIVFDTHMDPYKTLELNQMQAENAYRYIYSNVKNSEVEKYKSRIVNKKLYEQEKSMWDQWHEGNSKLEKEFEGSSAK